MAELATIARPYAEALFKASSSNLGATSAWLDKLAVISTDPALLQFANGPRTTTEQMLGIVTSANGAPLASPAQNFLGALLDNGRFAVLPEIAKQFRALANARSGSSDAVVYSAFPIDDAALVGVSAALEKRFGRKLKVTVQQEPALIGGIRVVVGDEVLDTSVKARLEQMKVALAA